MILIVDDDSAVRSSLSFMLKRAGYEVKTASGPREAMDVVRAESPALILMDMNFTLSTTGEEGLTLLKQVKVFRPDVPVISNWLYRVCRQVLSISSPSLGIMRLFCGASKLLWS